MPAPEANPSDEGRHRALRFTVVIPCYNEKDAIGSTIDGILSLLEKEEHWELIVVDDGSTDGTTDVLKECESRTPRLRVLYETRNRGYGASLKSGILAAEGQFVIITDADATYPNDRIPELLEAAADCEMVVGARVGDDVTYSKLRALPKVFLRRYSSWIANYNIPDINSGLRVMRRTTVLRFLPILPDGFSFTTTITLAMLTNYLPVKFIPINYSARVGKSKIKPIQDTLKFVQLIMRTGMYFAPLRVLFPIGFCLLTLAAVSLGYDILVVNNITDKTILFMLFSLNTLFFGLLADMLDKRTQKTPGNGHEQ